MLTSKFCLNAVTQSQTAGRNVLGKYNDWDILLSYQSCFMEEY